MVEPLVLRGNQRTILHVLLTWLLLIFASLAFCFPFGGMLILYSFFAILTLKPRADAVERTLASLESTQSDEERARRLWRLVQLLAMEGSSLEARAQVRGEQAVLQAHPHVLPLLLRAATSDHAGVRKAAYAGIAWFYDAYQCMLLNVSFNFLHISLVNHHFYMLHKMRLFVLFPLALLTL